MLGAYLIIIIFVSFFSIKYEIRLLEKCLNNFVRIFQVILERFNDGTKDEFWISVDFFCKKYYEI